MVPTTLQGRGCAFLESDKFQVIAMGNSANGIEIYNQFRTTAVVNTYTYQHLTIHILNAVIGFPGSYSFGAKFMGLNQFSALESTSGSPDLDGQHGMTIFAPSDDAFDPVKAQVASLSPSSLFANHVSTSYISLYLPPNDLLSTDHLRSHDLVSSVRIRCLYVFVWLQLYVLCHT